MSRLKLWLFVSAACGVALPAVHADDAKFVTVKGQLLLSAPPPVAIENVVTDKPVCCAAGPLESNRILVDPKSKGLKNCVVWLRPDDDDRKAKIPAEKISPTLAKDKVKSKEHVVDQPFCQFEPRVVAAREGDTIVFKNSSKISHNTNVSGCGLQFNVNVPAGSEYKAENPLAADPRAATFACNVHGWMSGRLYTFDHPYFAVTDKDGKFEIKEAPVGKFRIVYWHEGGYHKGKEGLLGFPIDIKDGGKGTLEVKPLEFEFPKANP